MLGYWGCQWELLWWVCRAPEPHPGHFHYPESYSIITPIHGIQTTWLWPTAKHCFSESTQGFLQPQADPTQLAGPGQFNFKKQTLVRILGQFQANRILCLFSWARIKDWVTSTNLAQLASGTVFSPQKTSSCSRWCRCPGISCGHYWCPSHDSRNLAHCWRCMSCRLVCCSGLKKNKQILKNKDG